MYRRPYKKKYGGKLHPKKGSPGGYKLCSCSQCRAGRNRDWGRRQFWVAKKSAKLKDRLILHIFILRGDEQVLDKLENYIYVGYTD
jgi:hypothetical protein